MTRQTFFQGILILLAAGMINRLLAFIPRIGLPRVIGAEGVGLYQMGYPLLIVIITLFTGGIPLAVAKMVAEAESLGQAKRFRQILVVSLSLTSGMGIVFTALCVLSASWITTRLLTDERVYFTILAMSPIVLIVSVSSVLRGYFQGRHNMLPTAYSQIAETLTRCAAVLLLAFLLLPYGVEFAAAGAMSGVMLGELAGMLMLLWQYKKRAAAGLHAHVAQAPPPHRGKRGIVTSLLRISIPVTAGRLVGSGSYFMESIMIVQSLAAAGVATQLATAQYGVLQGMVIPILLLPNALTYSLSVSLVPSLSEAAARKDMLTIRKRLHQSLRLALVAGAPFAVISYILAEPLCTLLYNDAEAGKLLKLMAPIALFIYLQSPLQAALQALDRAGTALLNTFVGAAVKLVLIFLLAAKLELGIVGAVLAINANIVLVTALHWGSVSRMLKFSMQTADLLKVGLAMLLMGGACWYVLTLPDLSGFAQFAAACMAGGAVYLCSLVWFKLIDRHDISRIPWIGGKISRWF